MKKKKTILCIRSLFIFTALVFLYACEKTEMTVQISDENMALEIPGVLSFNSFDEFSATADMLNVLSLEELEVWCKNNGIVSQGLLCKRLIIEEEMHEEKIISLYGEEVSIDFLKNESKFLEHSELYYNLLNQGIIKEIQETDGSTRYESTAFNPAYISALDPKGLVVIDNEIFQYNDQGLKIIHNGDISKIGLLPSITKNGEDEEISVLNYHSLSKGTCITINHYMVRYESSRERVSFRVYFSTGEDGLYAEPATCIGPSFYVEAKAQKKNIWGNWVYKSTYTPIDRVSGSWTYRFTMVEWGNPYNFQYIYSVTDPSSLPSPLLYEYFGSLNTTNHFLGSCIPDGWFCAPDGWLMDECTIYNYNFRMKAIGYSDIVFTD